MAMAMAMAIAIITEAVPRLAAFPSADPETSRSRS